jgi:hypothetical protein
MIFLCTLCNSKFTCKRNLNNHLNRKYVYNQTKFFCAKNPEKSIKFTEKTIKFTELRKNVCNYCNKEYSRPDIP